MTSFSHDYLSTPFLPALRPHGFDTHRVLPLSEAFISFQLLSFQLLFFPTPILSPTPHHNFAPSLAPPPTLIFRRYFSSPFCHSFPLDALSQLHHHHHPKISPPSYLLDIFISIPPLPLPPPPPQRSHRYLSSLLQPSPPPTPTPNISIYISLHTFSSPTTTRRYQSLHNVSPPFFYLGGEEHTCMHAKSLRDARGLVEFFFFLRCAGRQGGQGRT